MNEASQFRALPTSEGKEPHVEGFKLNSSWQGTLYFFSPPLLISFACFSRASSVRGGSPAFSIDLNTV